MAGYNVDPTGGTRGGCISRALTYGLVLSGIFACVLWVIILSG